MTFCSARFPDYLGAMKDVRMSGVESLTYHVGDLLTRRMRDGDMLQESYSQII